MRLHEKLRPDKWLSAKEVAALKSKEHIFVNNLHSVVVDVATRGSNVELVYVVGRKAFGKEQYMDIPLATSRTVIQSAQDDSGLEVPIDYAGESVFTAESLISKYLEGMSKGLHRAYSKLESDRFKFRCKDCGFAVPKYPGRYPAKCAHCGGDQFEDLQSAPVYSEGTALPFV